MRPNISTIQQTPEPCGSLTIESALQRFPHPKLMLCVLPSCGTWLWIPQSHWRNDLPLPPSSVLVSTTQAGGGTWITLDSAGSKPLPSLKKSLPPGTDSDPSDSEWSST